MEKYLDTALILYQLELLFRIILAGFCGGAIGHERESRRKAAGIRTHVIVAVSSALMIILSKYGFNDVLGNYVRLDPSRIAAGTVTAIGFLGSGIIFSRNHSVSGVTTSAGIWATLGVGMSVGAGMYLIGIITTVIVVLVETFIGRRGKMSYLLKEVYQIEIEYRLSTDAQESLIEKVRRELEGTYHCSILKFQVKKKVETTQLSLLVRTAKGKELIHLAELADQYPEIIKVSW